MTKIMRDKNKTKYQLSVEAGIPATTIHHYMVGRSYPEGDRLSRIAKILKTTQRRLVS